MGSYYQVVALVVAMVGVAVGQEGECLGESSRECFRPSSSTMKCSGLGLTQPPAGHWPDVVVLYLANDSVSALHPNGLSGFPNVYLLYLQENEIAEVDLQVFTATPQLSFLFLQRNRIRALTSAPGVRLERLSYLHLSDNSISSLDAGVLSAAPNLQALYVDNNPLVVPDGQPLLTNNPQLALLHVQHEGRLGALGARSLVGLPQLQEVVMDDAGVTAVDGAFLATPLLRSLSLQDNLITEIKPESFPAGGNLTTILLGGNPLARIHVSALDKVLSPGGVLGIQDTPLACACAYDALHWWAYAKGVTLLAHCNGQNTCAFV